MASRLSGDLHQTGEDTMSSSVCSGIAKLLSLKRLQDRVIQNNGTPTEEYGYVTDRLGQAACEFIEANKDHPFYLFVPLQPHTDL